MAPHNDHSSATALCTQTRAGREQDTSRFTLDSHVTRSAALCKAASGDNVRSSQVCAPPTSSWVPMWFSEKTTSSSRKHEYACAGGRAAPPGSYTPV